MFDDSTKRWGWQGSPSYRLWLTAGHVSIAAHDISVRIVLWNFMGAAALYGNLCRLSFSNKNGYSIQMWQPV